MLNILNNFLKRRNEHINLPLLIIFSLIISLVAGLLFYQTKIIWASAVLLIQTILGKEKEMEANLTDNKKFKVYQLNQKVQFKFSFFQYIKINPYFYIGLFYSFFSILKPTSVIPSRAFTPGTLPFSLTACLMLTLYFDRNRTFSL